MPPAVQLSLPSILSSFIATLSTPGIAHGCTQPRAFTMQVPYVALCSGQFTLGGGFCAAAARFAQAKFVVRLASRLEHIVFTAQVR